MGFRINTNIAAMRAHSYSAQTNSKLSTSLAHLSSGLRIEKASDDAAGMSIANQLKSQADGLGQAVRNANDGIGLIQTADGALEEYSNILNTIKTKSIQAANDTNSTASRAALQADITKLVDQAQNIATQTQFNGQTLLDGTFTDKKLQIGAYSNETTSISAGNAQSTTIGAHVNQEGAASTAATTAAPGALDATFSINGTVTGVSTVDSSSGANTTAHSAGSAWAKAAQINSVEGSTSVHAEAKTVVTGSAAVTAGTLTAGAGNNALIINGVDIGTVSFSANDSNGALRNAINAVSNQTNVKASISSGALVLTAEDGSDITLGAVATSSDAEVHLGDTTSDIYNAGKVTLSSADAVTVAGTTTASGFTATTYSTDKALNAIDVTSQAGAQDAILTAEFALKQVDALRSDLGSTQNQLESTVRNISVTQVNVQAAESQIRDVDFASESAEFNKQNILSQSGSYAMAQANAVQQNVMRLLQ